MDGRSLYYTRVKPRVVRIRQDGCSLEDVASARMNAWREFATGPGKKKRIGTSNGELILSTFLRGVSDYSITGSIQAGTILRVWDNLKLVNLKVAERASHVTRNNGGQNGAGHVLSWERRINSCLQSSGDLCGVMYLCRGVTYCK